MHCRSIDTQLCAMHDDMKAWLSEQCLVNKMLLKVILWHHADLMQIVHAAWSAIYTGMPLINLWDMLRQKSRHKMTCDKPIQQLWLSMYDTLKSKGHKPFYRGSSLKFRHADKTRTCRRQRALELQMPKFSATWEFVLTFQQAHIHWCIWQL